MLSCQPQELELEADADTRDDLMAREAELIIAVAIFALHIDPRSELMFHAAAHSYAVKVGSGAAIAGAGAAILVIEAEAGIAVAGLGIEQGLGRHDGADPAADI